MWKITSSSVSSPFKFSAILADDYLQDMHALYLLRLADELVDSVPAMLCCFPAVSK